MSSPYGIIAQDLNGTERGWSRIAGLGATHALIGVCWASVESEKGVYNFDHYRPVVEGAQEAGLTVILKLMWPMPTWKGDWGAVSQDGESSLDPTLFYPMSRGPSIWCDGAWDAANACQTRMLADLGSGATELLLISPASGGWIMHGDVLPEQMERSSRQLWCGDSWATASWDRQFNSDMPVGFPDAYYDPHFIPWYCNSLQARLQTEIARCGCDRPWVSVIPKCGYAREDVASGQPFMDDLICSLPVNVIQHCLLDDRWNPIEQQAYVYHLMRRWQANGKSFAIGCEGASDMQRTCQILAGTPCRFLLVGAESLRTCNYDHQGFKFWAHYWKERMER